MGESFCILDSGGGVIRGILRDIGIFDEIFRVIYEAEVFLNIISFIMFFVSLIALFVLSAFKWQFIGRKAGMQKDWMPFVPFARTVYKLSIVDEAWWRMFFKDGFWLYAWLLMSIINAISNYGWFTFALILCTLYGLCCIAYNVYFRYKFYAVHNIRPYLSLAILVPPVFIVLQVWDYLIAFGRNYPYTGEGTSRGMMNEVEVPQMKDIRENPMPVKQTIRQSQPMSYPKSQPMSHPQGQPMPHPVSQPISHTVCQPMPHPTGQTEPHPVSQPVSHSSGQLMPHPVSGGTPNCGLSGLSGMYAGQNIPMVPNNELIIGCDALLANVVVDRNADNVNRKHCGIRFDPYRNYYTVVDYSSNGTFNDGGSRLIANMPTTMQRGTIIALGNRENMFRLN